MIAGIDTAAGKDMRTGHERDRVVPPHHENLRAGAAVAQHDDGRGRPEGRVGCHAKTIARRPIC